MASRFRAAGVGWIALGAALLAFALHPWLLDRAEYSLLDARFRLRGPQPVSESVVIVAIDAASLDEFGRWPWRRSLLADLIDRLAGAGVAAIGVDLVFSEKETPAQTGALRLAREILAAKTSPEEPRTEEIALLDEALTETDTDARLAASVAANGRTALGYFFRTGQAEADSPEALASRLPDIRRSQVAVAKVPARSHYPILTCTGLEANVPVVAGAGRRSGFLSALADPDGVTRRAALVARCADSYYVSLALSVYELASGQRSLLLGDDQALREVRVGERVFPTDEGGKVLINFRGPPGTFPRISAGDVLAGRVAPGELAGALALIGATEVGLRDTRSGPFPGIYPGVEIHANLLDNLLAGDVLRRHDGLVVAELALIVLIGVLLIGVIPRTPGVLVSFLFATGLALALVVFGSLAFTEFGIWLNLAYPLATVVLVYLAVEVTRSLAVEARGRRVRDMFATYVPPGVVKALAEGEADLRLGGERRTLSLLFSDLRGFTSLSENLGPEGTIGLMNVYLEAMTRRLFETGGTLDKYIGDAVMAFWGAPLALEDHAERACRAALGMQEELVTFGARHPDLPGAEGLEMGVGIHMAEVVVGNVGSDLRFDYTVMGDGVNLCARLESLTKLYGVGILTSAELARILPASFHLREIDEIRVKGRRGAGVIYELLGERSADSADSAEELWLEAYAEGLVEYRSGRWPAAREAFARVIAARGEDGPSSALIERMEAVGGVPPDGWTGTWTFETK